MLLNYRIFPELAFLFLPFPYDSYNKRETIFHLEILEQFNMQYLEEVQSEPFPALNHILYSSKFSAAAEQVTKLKDIIRYCFPVLLNLKCDSVVQNADLCPECQFYMLKRDTAFLQAWVLGGLFHKLSSPTLAFSYLYTEVTRQGQSQLQ